MSISPEEIEDIAKEICYQIDVNIECDNDCDNCPGHNTWKKYKKAAWRLIKKIRSYSMAEERIALTLLNGRKPLITNSMTRAEAIEKMAKAICADDVMREGYYQLAEAALNALLGE